MILLNIYKNIIFRPHFVYINDCLSTYFIQSYQLLSSKAFWVFFMLYNSMIYKGILVLCEPGYVEIMRWQSKIDHLVKS